MPTSTCTNWGFPICCPDTVSPDDGGLLSSINDVTTGNRYGRFYNTTAATTVTLEWDFINPVTADYLFIAALSTTDNATLDEIRLQGSTDDITYTPEHTVYGFPELTGIRDNDLLRVFDTTPAYRYWQLEFEFTSAQQVIFSKVYFGTLFNFGGREPDADIREERSDRRLFRGRRTTAANVYRSRTGVNPYTYEIRYSGIPDAETLEFRDKVSYNRNTYAVMINTDYPELLNKHEVIHGVISGVELQQTHTNRNHIEFLFTEMVG